MSSDDGAHAAERERLRAAVERAIVTLGTGLLKRRRPTTKPLDPRALYKHLLRLVYRLLYLLTAEDRGHGSAGETRLRHLADTTRGARGGLALAKNLRLSMAELGDGARPTDDRPALDIADDELVAAIRALSAATDGSFRDVGADALGSTYETLLELHPGIHPEEDRFVLRAAAGHARKTTGSYYTSASLVDCVLDTALDPVLDMADNEPDPEGAILDLKICDPACGSGRFLVAAARRMAARLARARAGGKAIGPAEVQRALRDVIGACIYGVDLDPMALELCKISLWMEAGAPGKPLCFLPEKLREGNALLGATPALMAKGIPDAAFEPIAGDDKDVARRLQRRNKSAREKRRDRGERADAGAFEEPRFLADAWCAAFVWRKRKGALGAGAITQDLWQRMAHDGQAAPEATRREVNRLAREFSYFHWHLAFPDIFSPAAQTREADSTTGWRGGFDVVLGNPPWERLKLDPAEWFAGAAPRVARARNAAERARRIDAALAEDPAMRQRWDAALRASESVAAIARRSGRFPRAGVGDMNAYALFAELGEQLLRPGGRCGLLLPAGIVTDKTHAKLVQSWLRERHLVSVIGFINERSLFPAVLHNFKFCVLTLASAPQHEGATFAFGLLHPRQISTDQPRFYRLCARDVETLNPETMTCPVFVSGELARVVIALHRRLPRIRVSGWKVKPYAMLHMGHASRHFQTHRASDRAPVFEAKMVSRYNHRFAGFDTLAEGERAHMLPRTPDELLSDPGHETAAGYHIDWAVVGSAIHDRAARWLLVFRRIANPGLARTAAFCVIPVAGAGDSLSVLAPTEPMPSAAWAELSALVCWLGNTLVFDAILKQKMSGNNVSDYVFRQLPLPELDSLRQPLGWLGGFCAARFAVPRVVELSCSSRAVATFAKDLGFGEAVFPWAPERRQILVAELDALAALSYGLTRDELATLIDTFVVLRDREQRALGEFRTRRLTLELYDAMAAAQATGSLYQTLLDPLPAARDRQAGG